MGIHPNSIESYQFIKPRLKTVFARVLAVVGDREVTANDVYREFRDSCVKGDAAINEYKNTQSRMTTMHKKGLLKAIGEKVDPETKRTNTIYARLKVGEVCKCPFHLGEELTPAEEVRQLRARVKELEAELSRYTRG